MTDKEQARRNRIAELVKAWAEGETKWEYAQRLEHTDSAFTDKYRWILHRDGPTAEDIIRDPDRWRVAEPGKCAYCDLTKDAKVHDIDPGFVGITHHPLAFHEFVDPIIYGQRPTPPEGCELLPPGIETDCDYLWANGAWYTDPVKRGEYARPLWRARKLPQGEPEKCAWCGCELAEHCLTNKACQNCGTCNGYIDPKIHGEKPIPPEGFETLPPSKTVTELCWNGRYWSDHNHYPELTMWRARRVAAKCTCAETSARNCPAHNEPKFNGVVPGVTPGTRKADQSDISEQSQEPVTDHDFAVALARWFLDDGDYNDMREISTQFLLQENKKAPVVAKGSP